MHVKWNINITHRADTATREALTRIEGKIDDTMADLNRIKAEVAEMHSAVQGAETLLADLAQRIRDNATDEAALRDLADSLDADGTGLAAAVVENTPAETGGGTDGGGGDVTPPADGGGGDGGDGGVPV